jgi:hypothetical protein
MPTSCPGFRLVFANCRQGGPLRSPERLVTGLSDPKLSPGATLSDERRTSPHTRPTSPRPSQVGPTGPPAESSTDVGRFCPAALRMGSRPPARSLTPRIYFDPGLLALPRLLSSGRNALRSAETARSSIASSCRASGGTTSTRWPRLPLRPDVAAGEGVPSSSPPNNSESLTSSAFATRTMLLKLWGAPVGDGRSPTGTRILCFLTVAGNDD